MNGCSFQQVLRKNLGWFLSSFESLQKEHRYFYKTGLGIFTIVLYLRDRHDFMLQSAEILNDFNNLTLKQIFWKTKTFFKKLENHPLVENTTIENILFPYKTTMLEANVKINRMVSTKWTYHKEQSFTSNYFIL